MSCQEDQLYKAVPRAISRVVPRAEVSEPRVRRVSTGMARVVSPLPEVMKVLPVLPCAAMALIMMQTVLLTVRIQVANLLPPPPPVLRVTILMEIAADTA